MARRIELLLLALVSASALVAPIRRAVPRTALRSTPPESGASSASTDEATDADAATDAVAVAEVAVATPETETAETAADDAASASTKFRGADANKPKDYEDFNPDQPDIVQKFVKQRDDWWAADSPFPGAPVDKKGGDDGPIDSLAKIPVPAYLWLFVWKSISASGARQFFTKSVLGDDAAVLAPSSGEEPASPRHRASVASMAWRATRRFSTKAP